jgi:hypothetical protein
MMKHVLLAAFGLLLVQAAPASAQVSLQWKLKEGEKFYLEEKAVSKTTVSVMGNNLETKTEMTKVTEVVVKKMTREAIVLEIKMDSVSSKAEIMGNTVDSSGDLVALLKNVTFTLTMTPEGKVTKFQGYDQFLKNMETALAAADDEGKKIGFKMLKQMLTEETFKTSSAAIFDVLPVGPVKVGEQWKRVQRMPMGPMGLFKLDLNLTYKGPGEGNTEKIDVKGDFSHEASTADAGDALFKITKLDLTQKKIEGHLLFDKKTNRLTHHELNLTLAGKMGIDAGGMELEVGLEGTEARTTRLLEKRPAGD